MSIISNHVFCIFLLLFTLYTLWYFCVKRSKCSLLLLLLYNAITSNKHNVFVHELYVCSMHLLEQGGRGGAWHAYIQAGQFYSLPAILAKY